MPRTCWTLLGALALLTLPVLIDRAEGQGKPKEVWTDPSDPSLPADFKIQGEYVGEMKDGPSSAARSSPWARDNFRRSYCRAAFRARVGTARPRS